MTERESRDEPAKPLGVSKLVWFVGIWTASVLALGLVGLMIRWVLGV